MNDFFSFGKLLIIIGLIMAGIGLIMTFAGKIPWIGRLPGDIFYKGKSFTFYFPLTTSIVMGVIMTLIL